MVMLNSALWSCAETISVKGAVIDAAKATIKNIVKSFLFNFIIIIL
jgi:hypothetical protein